ncbi:MAG: macro domain-containing protein [Marinobacter sp.]|nr:macro domain-containing protein [Marinobacter sp.]
MTQVSIECVRGNIANQPDIDAIVNAANARLMPGSGVAGAIHAAAGPGLAEECRQLAPIEPGQAVISGGHDLPNACVIHCLGPVYGVDTPSEKLLADCYRNALELADRQGLSSIAFPAISTGVFGYPIEEAAKVAVSTIREVVPDLTSVRLIRLVLFSEGDLAVFRAMLASELPGT